MNNSWGYNMKDKNYMSPAGVVQYLVRTAGKGANLLLNIGPRPDGTLPEEALERLKTLGAWLKVNGETIYGTDGGCIDAQDWGVTTQRGKTLYVHLLPQTDKALPETLQLDIPKAQNRLKAATLFAGGEKIPFKQTSKDITLTLPALDNAQPDVILELTFAKEL